MKPILFNTEMVKAILDGRKTVTRRVVKPDVAGNIEVDTDGSVIGVYDREEGCVYPTEEYTPYHAGDILYVRETWCDPSGTGFPIFYKADLPMHWSADETEHGEAVDLRVENFKWRPSIHMPAWAARIFLRVKNIRVERLQDITAADILAEGLGSMCAMVGDMEIALQEWRNLWDSTIPKHPNKFKRYLYYWDDNPWVWVIEFERISREDAYSEM